MEQFIHTNTLRGFRTWGKSDSIERRLEENVTQLYASYDYNEPDKKRLKNPDMPFEEIFPIKRKYSKTEDGYYISQTYYIGKEVYNKSRYGNKFLHGFSTSTISKPPINCFLKEDFFKTELTEEQHATKNEIEKWFKRIV